MRSAGFSAAEKSAVTSACQNLIDDFLKPRFLPTIRPTQFNYPIDILGKWHGTKYRFIQRYRSGFQENLGEEFDAPFRPPRLDQPQPLRHPVAPSHRRMVLPASRSDPRRSDRHAKVQWIAPSCLNTASRLPRGTRRMDTFESPPPDDEADKRRFGYSRDKRSDCVQVMIALIVTRSEERRVGKEC